ncbi:ran GTPase-activating protein 1 [Rhopalosiphum maidis]|uniref:ran GTPase-activating protein 1 n=1 Tax=Rhopalosiphum maidis TaxID=43146 RepID=UPI000EFEF17A|nr:ran GTPase-activating protein 1 [Rhopalosiphum maidis]
MEDKGLSFADQSLSLNSAEDAKTIVSAIEKCPCLVFFNLQGNTLGIDAAKEIGHALAKHGSHLKHALWQDMFTGRLKSEIPIVLEHLSAGLLTANVRLSELDLSNNAFGPIGMQGLVKLLNSPVCYELHTLRLMNNGLGIGGAKMLAKALIDNYNASTMAGTPFKLKVLVAGRNRLENDGIIALSQFFSLVKTMEEITIPQNGIYCKGALAIAEALNVHESLENLDVSYNEINGESGVILTKVLCDKINLKEYNINGNRFGMETIDIISNTLKESNKDKTLGSFSGDEGECSSDEEDDNDEAEESSTDSEDGDVSTSYADKTADLMKDMAVGEVKLVKNSTDVVSFEILVDQLMDIAGRYQNADDKDTLDKCFELYKTAYTNATKELKFVDLTNLLLVKHGLIKSEDKKFQLRKDVGRCLEVLKIAVENKNVIPEPSQCVLSFMLKKKYSFQ